jgi:hypothetical protein
MTSHPYHLPHIASVFDDPNSNHFTATLSPLSYCVQHLALPETLDWAQILSLWIHRRISVEFDNRSYGHTKRGHRDVLSVMQEGTASF